MVDTSSPEWHEAMREQALERLAEGLDVDPEIMAAVTETGGHWTQVADEFGVVSVDNVEDLPECWRPPDGYTTERLAADLALVREQLASYRRQEADLVAALGERMRNRQERAGGWRLDRTWSAARKHWQSTGLVAELVRMARVTPDGEFRSDAEAMQWFVAAVMDCVPFTESLGWRVGGRAGAVGLRDYGLDPDEWCEKGQGHWSVTVTWDPEGPAS